MRGLDLAKEYGVMQPVARRAYARAVGGKGLLVDFEPIVGRPIVSAIRVRRVKVRNLRYVACPQCLSPNVRKNLKL